MKFQNQTLHLLQFKINLFLFMCVLFCSSFVCISAYANVYVKTSIIRQNTKKNSASKQHSCVRGPLRECHSIRSGASRLLSYCTPRVCISAVIGLLAVWRHNKPKIKNQNFEKEREITFRRKIRFCHCVAVLQTQVPKLCTDLDLSLLYILILGTYSK